MLLAKVFADAPCAMDATVVRDIAMKVGAGGGAAGSRVTEDPGSVAGGVGAGGVGVGGGVS
jgi:hypothetical protein